MNNDFSKKITHFKEDEIIRYSSNLLKRSLDLARILDQEEKAKLTSDNNLHSNKVESLHWKCTHKFRHKNKRISSVSLDYKKRIIAIVDGWGAINIWDLNDRKLLTSFNCHVEDPPSNRNYSFSDECFQKYGSNFKIWLLPQRNILLSSDRGQVKFWNLENGSLIRGLSNKYNISVNFRTNIIAYTTFSENNLEILSLDNSKPLKNINTQLDNIEDLVISSDGQLIIISGDKVIGGNWEEDEFINEHCIKIWETSTNRLIQNIVLFIDDENIKLSPSVHITFDNKILINVDQYKSDETELYLAQLWCLNSGELLQELKLENSLIATTVYNQLLVRSKEGNSINVFDITTGMQLDSIGNHSDYITSAKVGNKILFTGDRGGIIKIWNLETRELLHTLIEHNNSIESIELEPNNQMFVSIDSGGVVNIWKLSDVEECNQYQESYDLEFEVIEPHAWVSPEQLFRDGITAFEKSNYSVALENFNKVINTTPDNVYAFVYRATTRSAIGDKQGAMDDYTEALRINPGYAEVYNDRGLLRVELGDTKGGIEDYSQAMKSNPTFWKPYFNLGKLMSDSGDLSGAIQNYTRALNLDSNNILIYILRASDYLKLENYADALADYERAIYIDPEASALYFETANQSIQDCDVNLHIDLFTKYLLNCANQYYLSKSHENALDICTKLINILPANSEVFNKRSSIRSALGDYVGAVEDMDKALSLLSLKKPEYDFLSYLRLLVEYQKHI